MTEVSTQPARCAPSSQRPVVLVVDDEKLLRTMVAEYLREAGFRVLEAADGTEAVMVLAAGAAVDVVFSDVRMPGGVSGYDLAQWVKAHRPAASVLLASGYVGEFGPGHGTQDEAPLLLAKPYNYERLLQLLHDLIGRREPPL